MPNASKTAKFYSEAAWDTACEFHVSRILAQAEAGHPEAAGRHAAALVHMAVTRRAFEIMGRLGLNSYWKAEVAAEFELFDVRFDLSEPKGSGSDCAPGEQPVVRRVERSAA
jgi:hypothetical protein